MIDWLKKIITKIYWFVWDWLLCRKEMFTPQLTRMMIHHGIFFWFFFLGIAGFCFYHIFNNPSFWEAFFSLSGLITIAWLTDHLIDTARNNPEYKD